jgi:hypothetical protein
MPMFSNDNHLHQVTYELNGVRSLLSEILFYFVFFATIYVGIQIGRFIFHHFLQPMNNNEDIDLLHQRLVVTEQSVEALISHLNRLREEQVNVFEPAPTHVSHPATPVRPKKKSDVEKALPESASDSGESEESKKDV